MFSILIFIVPLTIVTLVLLKDSLYIDVTNDCFIRIEKESLDGDKKDISNALLYLKNNSAVDYKYVCESLDSIVLGKCIASSKTGPSVLSIDTRACYIKGTKSVFINTVSSNNNYDEKVLADNILKYSKESRVFWRSKQAN